MPPESRRQLKRYYVHVIKTEKDYNYELELYYILYNSSEKRSYVDRDSKKFTFHPRKIRTSYKIIENNAYSRSNLNSSVNFKSLFSHRKPHDD